MLLYLDAQQCKLMGWKVMEVITIKDKSLRLSGKIIFTITS